MNMIFWASFLSAIVFLHLGLRVYKIDHKLRENRLFLILCLALMAWCMNYALIYSGMNIDLGAVWRRMLVFYCCILGSLLLHFTLVFSKVRIADNRIFLAVLYLLSIVLMLDKFFDINRLEQNIILSYSLLFLHAANYTIYFILSFVVIIAKSQKASSWRERRQCSVVAFTGVLSLVLALANGIFIIFFPESGIKPMFHITSLIWAAGVWYSIQKYGFVNIQKHIKADEILQLLKDLVIITDTEGHILQLNKGVLKILQYEEKDLLGKHIKFIMNSYSDILEIYQSDLEPRLKNNIDINLQAKSGRDIPVNISMAEIRDNSGEAAALVFVGQDMRIIETLRDEIIEHKKAQSELSYLSYHDSLTGLFNRTSFECKMRELDNCEQLSAGIIICDLDGLKLINDTLGHEDGDELIASAARVISQSVDSNYMVARIGGDEFAIVATGVTVAALEDAYVNIEKNIKAYNETMPKLPLSISIGYAASEDKFTNMRDIFKQADNNMYRKKLYQSQHTKDSIIKALIKALRAKDFIEQGHADRVYDMMVKVYLNMGLPEHKMNDLWLFAQFHDIGKVGVADNILFKEKPLEYDEVSELRRHCEIGYRIARSSPELEPIAEWILKHHEWWNGKGYPMGLSNEEIPVVCRILAVVDAFDVMTTDRPYRKAITSEQALAEIEKYSNKQFDADIVCRFRKVLELSYAES